MADADYTHFAADAVGFCAIHRKRIVKQYRLRLAECLHTAHMSNARMIIGLPFVLTAHPRLDLINIALGIDPHHQRHR